MPGTTKVLHLHLRGQRLVPQRKALTGWIHVHSTRRPSYKAFRDVWQGEYWWLLPHGRRWPHGKKSLDDEWRESKRQRLILDFEYLSNGIALGMEGFAIRRYREM